MLFAGIRRDHRFSPNHVGNDRAVFELTAGYLRQMGHRVNEYGEGECMKGIGEQAAPVIARRIHRLSAK
ncbi:MAG: hypothetical protein LBL04_05980 [Bacteroidales bacterium]|nr:hypothetical protein [Bacteroidales bacterium]